MDDEMNSVESLERENETVTRAFNQAWSDRDCDTLLTLLSDDVKYMVYEGGPVYEGPETVGTVVGRFMAKFERIEFKIRRMNVMGPVVSHERTEDYYAPGGERDTHFHVVGLLVIQHGKILLWRDYSMPGAEQIVGPLCTKKDLL